MIENAADDAPEDIRVATERFVDDVREASFRMKHGHEPVIPNPSYPKNTKQ
jgi:hypothetical protein